MRRQYKTRKVRFEKLETRRAMDAAVSIDVTQHTPELAFRPIRDFSTAESVRHFARTDRVDVNQDNVFSSLDVLHVINALASTDDALQRLDVNGDGQVSSLDALVLINELHRSGGQQVLLPVSENDVDDQRSDAIQFVSNLSTGALPDDDLVETIAQDFARIEAAYSDLGIWVDAPSPGAVRVFLTPEDREAFDAGKFERLDELNAELGVRSIARANRWNTSSWPSLILTFSEPYSYSYLQERYRAVEGIRDVTSPGYSGIGGPYGIEIKDPQNRDGSRSYRLQYGYGDCPAGCIYMDIVLIRVTEQSVHRTYHPEMGVAELVLH